MVGRKNKNIMVGKYNKNNVNKKGTPTSMSMTFILIIYTFFHSFYCFYVIVVSRNGKNLKFNKLFVRNLCNI